MSLNLTHKRKNLSFCSYVFKASHAKEKTCPYVLMSLKPHTQKKNLSFCSYVSKNHTFRLILFFGGVVFLLQSE